MQICHALHNTPPYLYCAPLIYFVERKKKKHLGRVLSANVQELGV